MKLYHAADIHLGRRRLEEAFAAWIDGLKQSYPLEVNQAVWRQVTDPAPAAGK